MSDFDTTSTDAGYWAKQFIQHGRDNGWTLEDIDEDLMVSWFANYWAAVRDPLARELSAEREANARLREELIEAKFDHLSDSYAQQYFDDKGRWSHSFMSDGEWLAAECGFNPRDGWYPVEGMEARIRAAAERSVEALAAKGEES